METQEKPTITLDDKNYIIEDLPETARYCIGQLQDLQQQSQATRARLDQLEMSSRGFTDMLRQEIAKMNEPEVVEGEEA
jgi:hypothetical protein